MQGKRILITGGAGFIGSALVRHLAEAHSVIAVDNLVNGRKENLSGLEAFGVEFVHADIRDHAAMTSLLRNVDVVFHLACLGVRHSLHSPEENHDVNATGTLHLLQMSKAAGVKRFNYVSSSEVYGTALSVPMSENHPTFPCTVYGSSKLAGECYTRSFFRTYGYPTTVIRPFNAFGPRGHHEGDSGEVIPKFLLRSMAGLPLVLFGDGSQTRDFTYVTDTADGIAKVGFSAATVGDTLNIGSGSEVSIERLAEMVRRVTGRSSTEVVHEKARPGDVLRLYADTSKAQALVGFKPAVSLSSGLTLLKDWYIQLPETPASLLQTETVRNWEVAR